MRTIMEQMPEVRYRFHIGDVFIWILLTHSVHIYSGEVIKQL